MRIRLAALLLLLACSKPVPPAAAPAFTLPDLAGKPVSLSDFAGKVVLLDFWATWCEPCREELPELLKLHETFAARGLAVVGIAMDAGGRNVVGEYARSRRVPYRILLTEGQPLEGYRVLGLPTAFLIDRSGRIVGQYLGPKSFAELAAAVEPLLAAPVPK